MNEGEPADHWLEHWVSRSLLAGVLLSSLLLMAGVAVSLATDQQRDQGPPAKFSALVNEALQGRGAAFLDLGLLALIATPIVRVGVLAAGWAIGRDYRFAMTATAVLALLGLSIYLGAG